MQLAPPPVTVTSPAASPLPGARVSTSKATAIGSPTRDGEGSTETISVAVAASTTPWLAGSEAEAAKPGAPA